jgi:hypothetical protein
MTAVTTGREIRRLWKAGRTGWIVPATIVGWIGVMPRVVVVILAVPIAVAVVVPMTVARVLGRLVPSIGMLWGLIGGLGSVIATLDIRRYSSDERRGTCQNHEGCEEFHVLSGNLVSGGFKQAVLDFVLDVEASRVVRKKWLFEQWRGEWGTRQMLKKLETRGLVLYSTCTFFPTPNSGTRRPKLSFSAVF